VIDAVGDRVKVVAGVGTNNTAHSVELAEQAFKLGADGGLLVTPYYSKPTQEGVAAHFEAVAAATELPLMLYDIPGRSGIAIAEDTYKRVAESPRIVGHVAGDEYAAMVRAVEAGDLGEALAIYRRLVPVVDAVMNRAPGAMTAKAAMQLLGVLDNRRMRLPLVPAGDDLVAHLRTQLENAGLLETE
jgi:4-hydroxy-tetrahydrodipicolinate synthase